MQSSISTARDLLRFLRVGWGPMSHICTEDDRGRGAQTPTAIRQRGMGEGRHGREARGMDEGLSLLFIGREGSNVEGWRESGVLGYFLCFPRLSKVLVRSTPPWQCRGNSHTPCDSKAIRGQGRPRESAVGTSQLSSSNSQHQGTRGSA